MMIPVFLLLLFVGGLFSTIAGGGLGIVLVIAGSFFFDIKTSIVLNAFLGLAIQFAKITHFHRHTRWDIVRWYILTGIPASLLAGFLLFAVPEAVPRIGLGLVCLLFVAMHVWKVKPAIGASPASLMGLGAVNGVMSGMIGNGSLLRMPALLTMGVTKETFVATSSMIALLMNLGRLSAYSLSFSWTPTLALLLALSVPTLLVSVGIGKRLLRYVSVQVFEDLQLIVILVGAIKLLLFP